MGADLRGIVALIPADEHLHAPGPGPGWQENCFLLGWDGDTHTGFYAHVERFPAGRTELKAVLLGPSQVVSVCEEHPSGSTFDIPGFELAVVDPFRELRLRLDLKGHPGDGAWLAGSGSGATRLALDVRLRNSLPPIDWRPGLERFGIAGVDANHYEVGGTWEGEVVAGEHAVTTSGLFLRDHSWGARDLTNFDLAWWTPMVFAGGTVFASGISFHHRGGWVGETVVTDGGQPEVFDGHRVGLDGEAVPRGYRAAEISAPAPGREAVRISATVEAHVPVEYPGFAPDYYMNDAFCTLDWGGRSGFGMVELNSRLGVGASPVP